MSKVYLAVGDDFEIEDAEMEAGPPRMAAPLIVVDAVDAPAGPKRCSSCIREATTRKERINLKKVTPPPPPLQNWSIFIRIRPIRI
jgi:hypothetical protein